MQSDLNFGYHIGELNGFLRAIGLACGPKHIFGLKYAVNNDLSMEGFLGNVMDVKGGGQTGGYRRHSEISYNELTRKMDSILVSGNIEKGIASSEGRSSYFRALLECINDYLGLTSTAINPKANFYPLLNGPVFEVEIFPREPGSSLFFCLKIEDVFLFFYLYKKT